MERHFLPKELTNLITWDVGRNKTGCVCVCFKPFECSTHSYCNTVQPNFINTNLSSRHLLFLLHAYHICYEIYHLELAYFLTPW